MKIKYFEYITVYLSVFLVCVFVGAIGRLVLLEKEGDQRGIRTVNPRPPLYTAFLIFVTGFEMYCATILPQNLDG